MKTLLSIFVVSFALNSFATVDMQADVAIVTYGYDLEEFRIVSVPAEFCVGIPAYALAQAITQPVSIKTNYGCGTAALDSQINEASCAVISVTESEVSYDLVDVKMDLSFCGDKATNDSFVRALNQAIYKTFNDNGLQIRSLN